MLTNKKRLREWMEFLLLAAVAVWLAGCAPSGPRALLRGKRLIEQGKYEEAVDQLKVATSLLSTNAQAWNYLGLAYHHARQPANAVDAYHRALKLNHDMVEVHYNLGCLLLEENRPDTLDGARNELTTFVLHRGNSIDGWLKLGTAQMRLAEYSQAEATFKEALRLAPQNVEALNDLGVILMGRRHNRDAAGYFTAALKLQPNYAPAILNLAVAESYLNNPSRALQYYREYLALNPRPANWEAVNTLAQQLDQQLNPPAHSLPPANAVASNPITNNANHPTPTNISRPENVASQRPAPQAQPRQQPVQSEPSVRPEVVRLPESPSIRTAGQAYTAPQTQAQPSRGFSSGSVASSEPEVIGEPGDLPEAQSEPKRGLLAKLNPFHRRTKAASKPIPVTPLNTGDNGTEPEVVTTETAANSPARNRPVNFARYPYLSPGRPPTGNHTDAERFLAQAVEAQRENRLSTALGLCRSAAQEDPAYFDAQSTLGLIAFQTGNLPEALRAYEMALAIKPDSFSARFNFALALKQANYIKDAADELERLLASNSSGQSASHLAMVHLTLANLYAEQFHQPAPAKAHYLKVLELDPHNSQATSIRYWLQANG